ncbi:MAG: DUF3568 family protein [Thermodesulfobacteriota bacterium]|nr:DUF3568 family protein [Thermodesulfobacteriota bacterium]
MLKRNCWMLVVLAGIFFVSSCSLQVGGRIAGIHSGKFFYTDGNLVTNYGVSFEKTWKACEKTLIDMNASLVEIEKRISEGTLKTVLEGDDIRISVEYLERNRTKVSVRVGLAGDNIASEMIQKRIRENLINM